MFLWNNSVAANVQLITSGTSGFKTVNINRDIKLQPLLSILASAILMWNDRLERICKIIQEISLVNGERSKSERQAWLKYQKSQKWNWISIANPFTCGKCKENAPRNEKCSDGRTRIFQFLISPHSTTTSPLNDKQTGFSYCHVPEYLALFRLK